MLAVGANGSVAPCYLVYLNMLTMGKIKEESLQYILEKNENFIRDIKNGNYLQETCRQCRGHQQGEEH
jgi:radical SAM protein with 4Fe4S-binding SPASM domain